ncbi:MAG: hypothetical protein HDT39_09315 [Lachnospiraceae bacterium]|nr:hypothetical protein [Lachnospiraceae bacterium]
MYHFTECISKGLDDLNTTLPKGVFTAQKKDGTLYYRSSLTYKNRHISLGSYEDKNMASLAYIEGRNILDNSNISISDYSTKKCIISFDKWVCLVNFRDNGIYFKTPIYMHSKYFDYFYDKDLIYKFDFDDLFFYSHHKIMKRNGHLFVADYGMQINILSRYGIHSHSVEGRDYIFVNGDNTDFRYKNIKVINHYKGVFKSTVNGREIFTSKIHVNGDFIIGRYNTECEAAVAYNKAVHILHDNGIDIDYEENYVEELSPIEYAAAYNAVRISEKVRKLRL